jgi:cellulose synthase (UDP-forming)
MQPDTLPLVQLLGPLAVVLGACLLGTALPLGRPWARVATFIVVWIVVARYMQWRFAVTVLPAQGAWYQIGWIWLCFAVELLALTDQFILYVTFLRTSDRRREADTHEALLRSLSPAELPSVDVYIATYNEPIEILEKTITGALCLDYPNVKVWVLDDGRRPWLKALCEGKGVGYITRPDNAHAKAGNINHALARTDGEFVAIFDADFIPQRDFLMRTIGFFSDPKVGIVQAPHTFYNHDPMQNNLGVRNALPDEQRLFFETIMPARDGWDAAFCCGSNSVTRRSALRTIGNAVPTQAITEDILLTLVLLRKGYITRYLCEPLAFGLAPEDLNGFFIQRQRWARGAIQILYLAAGPLRGGLGLMHRLLFLPTHWLSLGVRTIVVVLAPIVFLWTGVSPVVHVTPEAVLYYLIPMIIALYGGMRTYTQGQYFPLAAQVSATIQSFKILPTVAATLVKPFGHPFKVTPKGHAARASAYASDAFWIAAALMALTAIGLVVNAVPEWRIVDPPTVWPIVACWGAINILVLFLTCMTALQAPTRRGEERFAIEEPICVFDGSSTPLSGRTKDVSLAGAGILIDPEDMALAPIGTPIRIFLNEVGFIQATVAQRRDRFLGIRFELPKSVERDLLIRRLFTSGLLATPGDFSGRSATLAMLGSIWSMGTRLPRTVPPSSSEAHHLSEKLPSMSLMIGPRRQATDLDALAKRRLIPYLDAAYQAASPGGPRRLEEVRPEAAE